MRRFYTPTVLRNVICGMCVLTLVIGLSPAALARVVFQNDFNDDPTGTYSVSNLKADWNNPSWNDGVSDGRVTVIDGSEAYKGKSIKARYPAHSYGYVQWIARFDKHFDELYSSFWIKFDKNFDFVRGGKVPGMCGGMCNEGGDKPNGQDGFGGIMMWRPNGKVVQYVYHPDQPGMYGEDFPWNIGGQRYFEPGQWHQIENYIKMNTPGQRNGMIKGWFDGELALEVANMRFRDVDTFGVDAFFFQTHFGGGDSSWQPNTDQHIYYDEFVVATERVGEGGPGQSELEGDVNEDGMIDIFDLVLIAQNFGKTSGFDSRADANGDGKVDIFDLVVVAQHFGETG
jgi:hypothetical protein